MVDPHTAEQQYYYCQGLLANGQPMIDPDTGLPTKFWLAGDPVTGEGWIWKDLMSPMDVRCSHSTGPFTMAPGDTQDVVLGIIVGMGADNLSSITAMRYYDRFAQQLYDHNFGPLPSPPQPVVTAHPLDSTIVLDWNLTAAGYEQDGYVFEGYNVWQGESIDGPWVKIETFDMKNGITQIWDFQYNCDLGVLIEVPVIMGTDEGLANTIIITEDVFNNNDPLLNGTPYYFAVTAYAYNPDESPKVFENQKAGIEVVPQRPVLDVAYTQEPGTELNAVLGGPQSASTWGKAVVVDPGQLTGHEYRVDFKPIDGEYSWGLTDVTTGDVKLENQTNFSGDGFYTVIDGAKFIICGILPSEYGLDATKGFYGQGWGYSGSNYITGVDWGGHAMFGGLDLGENLYGSNLSRTDYKNVEIHFWNTAHNRADPVTYPWTNCQTYDRTNANVANGIGTFPGAAYDVDDPVSPRRLNICFMEQTLVDRFWDPIAANSDGYGGCEYVFIMNSDYLTDPTTLYDDDNRGYHTDVLYAFWPAPSSSSDTGEEEFKLYIWCTHPLTVGATTLTFDTRGWEPVKSRDVAKTRLDEINVFPNPYMVINQLERLGASQFVTFNNLPADKCVLRIFTLNGETVAVIEHDNGTPFERWDLRNQHGYSVGSGMYFIHVSTEYGNRILKLAVLNRGR